MVMHPVHTFFESVHPIVQPFKAVQLPLIDPGLIGEVSRGEKMTLRGTDPESYTPSILACTKISQPERAFTAGGGPRRVFRRLHHDLITGGVLYMYLSSLL